MGRILVNRREKKVGNEIQNNIVELIYNQLVFNEDPVLMSKMKGNVWSNLKLLCLKF